MDTRRSDNEGFPPGNVTERCHIPGGGVGRGYACDARPATIPRRDPPRASRPAWLICTMDHDVAEVTSFSHIPRSGGIWRPDAPGIGQRMHILWRRRRLPLPWLLRGIAAVPGTDGPDEQKGHPRSTWWQYTGSHRAQASMNASREARQPERECRFLLVLGQHSRRERPAGTCRQPRRVSGQPGSTRPFRWFPGPAPLVNCARKDARAHNTPRCAG